MYTHDSIDIFAYKHESLSTTFTQSATKKIVIYCFLKKIF